MARFFDQQMGEKDSSQIKLFKELINETQKQLSINELQKELMQMKIILRLLLSTEQFAALQLCGYFINSEKQLTPSEINPVKQSQRMQDIQNQVKISNKESERNQIEENQNIIESCQQNSEKKYNQIENMNKCILSNENIVDDTNQKDSQNSKIQSLIQKNMTFRIDDNDFSQNVQLNENVFQKNPQNHLDSIYKVENNIHYFEQSISRFLDSKYSKSELDKRILSCMIGFDEKELG